MGLRVNSDGSACYSGSLLWHLNNLDTKWLQVFLVTSFVKSFTYMFLIGWLLYRKSIANEYELLVLLFYFFTLLIVKRFFVRRDAERSLIDARQFNERPFRLLQSGLFNEGHSGFSYNGTTFFIVRSYALSRFFLAEVPKVVSEEVYIDALKSIQDLKTLSLPFLLMLIFLVSFVGKLPLIYFFLIVAIYHFYSMSLTIRHQVSAIKKQGELVV